MAGVHQLPAVGLPEEKGALGANLPVPSASRLGDPSNKDVSGSASDSDIEQLEDEMRGRTLMEKKMILINRALNAQGMGRYQVCEKKSHKTSTPVHDTSRAQKRARMY